MPEDRWGKGGFQVGENSGTNEVGADQHITKKYHHLLIYKYIRIYIELVRGPVPLRGA
jgi:hypothetical protein